MRKGVLFGTLALSLSAGRRVAQVDNGADENRVAMGNGVVAPCRMGVKAVCLSPPGAERRWRYLNGFRVGGLMREALKATRLRWCGSGFASPCVASRDDAGCSEDLKDSKTRPGQGNVAVPPSFSFREMEMRLGCCSLHLITKKIILLA